MTLSKKTNGNTWKPDAKPELVTPFDAAANPATVTQVGGEPISVKLAQLGTEARQSGQLFLAHLIGMAVLEAENLEKDQSQLSKSPSLP